MPDASVAQEHPRSNAGVVAIQPGIESFSTELLALMRKHTSRIRHMQFLRWCHEYVIDLNYNLLAGFPQGTGRVIPT
ncbi:MAG TPA: hypothetical protein VHF06_25565 [Pseudonocardiaceae bacterium]|nr:hypothetical protein [Pseudonocardiaceae bacterium]